MIRVFMLKEENKYICVNTDNDVDAQNLLNNGAIELAQEKVKSIFGDYAHMASPDNTVVSEDGETIIFNPPTISELESWALVRAKEERAEAVSKIIVEVDGMKFDGDETAQTRMGRTISAATALGVDINTYTQTWVLADNTVATPTIKQLAQALKLAGEEQTKLWTVPYNS